MKKRILNPELAAIVATLRHGEMIFIADAGSGTCAHALYPLDESVKYIDLGAVIGSPSFKDIITTLVECGDFESALITEDMVEHNQDDYGVVTSLFDEEHIDILHYIPEYYQMRDRCVAVVQTGDYGIHAQAILVAGYSTNKIPMEWLKEGIKK